MTTPTPHLSSRPTFRALVATFIAACLLAPAVARADGPPAWPTPPNGELVVQSTASPEGGWYGMTNFGGIWTSGNAPGHWLFSYLGYAAITPNPGAERAAHGQFAPGGFSLTRDGYLMRNVHGESYTFTGPIEPEDIGIAASQVGLAGPYTAGGFWCAKFVSWVARKAFVPGFVYEDGPAALMGDAQRSGRITAGPQIGGLVYIDLTGQGGATGYASHVALIEWTDGVTINTIEGNGDNTGVVDRHIRHVGDGYVFAFSSI